MAEFRYFFTCLGPGLLSQKKNIDRKIGFNGAELACLPLWTLWTLWTDFRLLDLW